MQKQNINLFNLFNILFLLVLFGCGESSQNNQSNQSKPASQLSNQEINNQNKALAFKGSDVSKKIIGGDFTLVSHDNPAFQLSSLKGKVVILTFGFSHCSDVCPTELSIYADVFKQLNLNNSNNSNLNQDVAVVFVSIDPERDTPDLINRYVKQFNNHFIGLTENLNHLDNLEKIKKQYGIIAAKTEIKSDKIYNVDHTAGTYLLDKSGKVRVFEPYGTADATQIADDIRLLLNN